LLFWQFEPVPQTVPQAPQLLTSEVVSTQEPPHTVMSELQVGPFPVPTEAGFAQLATKSAAPSREAAAQREVRLTSMF